MLKHEWRKKEKPLYIPKASPELIEVPKMKFITLCGEGSPADDQFIQVIGALYSLAYTIKMTLKKYDNPPQNYYDFTVYPLEGVWDINEDAKKNFAGTVNKEDFVYQMMIRQPNFITEEFYQEMLHLTRKNKHSPLLKKIEFQSITEGPCVQMLHCGSFDDEPITFKKMETYAENQQLTRFSKVHREIYLSDARRVAPENLKTVLRFQVDRTD